MLSSSRHMAQVMLPRLRSQMGLSAVRDTPSLLSRCRGANTLAAVCLPARPARFVQVSSGSSYNEQTAASYDQTMRSSSGSSPGMVQGGRIARHPSAVCQLPLQQGIYNKYFEQHSYQTKTAVAEVILAEMITPESLYDDYITRIAEELCVPHTGYISYVRNNTQDLQPLPRPSKSIPVMIGGELVGNLKGMLKELVPDGPILYTITAHLPGADWKTLLYIGQSEQGLTRMLNYCQEDEDFFGDSQDSLKKAYMLDLAARGATIELQFVEVPDPLEAEALEKEVLKIIDFPLNKIYNGQVREPQLLVRLSEIITKHPEKASKAAQIRRDIEAKDARDMHSTEVEDMPNPVLRTLLTNVFRQEAAEVNKMYREELKARWQQVAIGLQNSGSTDKPFVIAMTDFRDQSSPKAIIQYNKSELETAYYTHYGKLPRKMSKDKLLQEVLELSNGVAASGNDADCQDPINNVQERSVSGNPRNTDVLPPAAAHSHPIGSTSSTTCAASDDSKVKSPQLGRRPLKASKAGGSSAVSAINVSKSNNSQQQITDSKNTTSAGGEELSGLRAPVLRGLVLELCKSEAAKSRKGLTKKNCLVLLENMLPKEGTKAASAAVAMCSFHNKITPEYLRGATRPILDAFYYFSEGRVVTSQDMKVEELRDFLLRKINDGTSILNLPLMEEVPHTSQSIEPAKRRRQSKKKAANADKQSMPKDSRYHGTTQKHQHQAFA